MTSKAESALRAVAVYAKIKAMNQILDKTKAKMVEVAAQALRIVAF